MNSFVDRRRACCCARRNNFNVLHNLGDMRLREIERQARLMRQPTHQGECNRRDE